MVIDNTPSSPALGTTAAADATGSGVWQGWSTSSQHTSALGVAVGRLARQGEQVALYGQLGAGKTQLVRGLVAAVGVDAGEVSSPTFVLAKQYHHAASGTTVMHVDAYRLDGAEDAETIGWGSDLFAEAITVVEWADRLGGQLASNRLDIVLEHADTHERRVSVVAFGSWCDRIRPLHDALVAVRPTPEDP